MVLYLVVVLCLVLELIVSDSLWWWFSWLLLCLFMVGLFSCYLTACCIYLFELLVWLLFCNSVAVIWFLFVVINCDFLLFCFSDLFVDYCVWWLMFGLFSCFNCCLFCLVWVNYWRSNGCCFGVCVFAFVWVWFAKGCLYCGCIKVKLYSLGNACVLVRLFVLVLGCNSVVINCVFMFVCWYMCDLVFVTCRSVCGFIALYFVWCFTLVVCFDSWCYVDLFSLCAPVSFGLF